MLLGSAGLMQAARSAACCRIQLAEPQAACWAGGAVNVVVGLRALARLLHFELVLWPARLQVWTSPCAWLCTTCVHTHSECLQVQLALQHRINPMARLPEPVSQRCRTSAGLPAARSALALAG